MKQVMRTGQAGIQLIKAFEGLPDGNPQTVNLDPYMDPLGIWTIGWGHALSWQGRWLTGMRDRKIVDSLYPVGITPEEAQSLLAADLVGREREVMARIIPEITQEMFDALISFHFNTGGITAKSCLLRDLINAGKFREAAEQFPKWNKGGGKVISGLVRRRAAERELFLEGVGKLQPFDLEL